ncbi:MAG: hypothetical protein JW795_12300 [Chitinivibrionales bacterium]|nr:hypothetical protein [Chitinivibrionales bacterium]
MQTIGIFRRVIITGMVGCALGMMCTTKMPSKPSGTPQTISISLINKDTTRIVYHGQDVNAIIEFSDSVRCDFNTVISLHRLAAKYLIPNEMMFHLKIKSLTLPLFWTDKAGLPKDSVHKLPHDSLWVQVGLNKSNIVHVFIANLPPIIDSIVVGDSIFQFIYGSSKTQSFNYYIRESTNGQIPLRLRARDSDTPRLSYSWANSGDDRALIWNPVTNPQFASYKIAGESFSDVITGMVYDLDVSAQVNITVIKNKFPVEIDSVGMRDTLFRNRSIGVFDYRTVVFDSCRMRIFHHRQLLWARWSCHNGIISSDTLNDKTGCIANYRCTVSTAMDTLFENTTVILDTLRFVLKNVFGDSLVRYIRIIKHPSNIAPRFDSIFIDTIKVRGQRANDSSMIFHTIPPGSSIALSAFAVDPDGVGDAVSYIWYGNTIGTLTSATSAATHYKAARLLYGETVELHALDSDDFQATKMIHITSNTNPAIDSVRINTALFRPNMKGDTIFELTLVTPDSVSAVVYSHDNDVSLNDHITSQWVYRTHAGEHIWSVSPILNFVSGHGTYTDTVVATVNDILNGYDYQKVIIHFIE